MISTILFDYYGVFQPDPYAEWLTKNGLRREAIYDELVKRLDHGEIARAEFLGQLTFILEHSVTFDEIFGTLQAVRANIVAIAATLKQQYRIGLLSNADTSLRSKLKQEDILHLFDQAIISSEVGVAKPHRAIFELALEMLESDAAQTIFIDDNPHNIKTAAELGMPSILFTDSESLRRELTRYDIAI